MERTPHRTPEAYKQLELASAVVLLFMTVWAPWAFGSGGPPYQTILCGAGHLAGLLLIGKWVVRRVTGYTPARWAEPTPFGTWVLRLMAALTVLFLAYVAAGVFNARAVGEYIPAGADQGVNLNYVERTPIPWLPSSYDAPVSWNALWRWMGIAWAFWAARDWFLGKTRSERRETDPEAVVYPGSRLRLWLWVLAGSTFALATVSVVQRLDGTNKLLWLVTPKHPDPNTPWDYPTNFHFGPFNYRGNASQYLNLIWPLVLGFWKFTRDQERKDRGMNLRMGQGPHVLLLPWALLIAAGPIISGSRGGVLVTALLAVAFGILFAVTPSRWSLLRRLGVFSGVLLLLLAMVWLGGSTFLNRVQNPEADPSSNRRTVYEECFRMMSDFKWLGSGADTFATIQPFYRKVVWEQWTGYAHNDLMEFVITLGIVGTSMLLLLLASGLLMPRCQRREDGGTTGLMIYFQLAMIGLLLHSLLDFPFQMVSLQVEFLLVLAAFSTLVQRDSASSGEHQR